MMTRLFVFMLSISAWLTASADDVYKADRERWLRIAEKAKPELRTQTLAPQSVVELLKDATAFQGVKVVTLGGRETVAKVMERNFKDVKSVTFDFGKHMVGHFKFHTKTLGTRPQDAPVRLRFFFGELPAELETPLDPWRGSLSRAWMQDEVVTVTQVDKWMEIPRRVAFRYLKVELLGASNDFDFALDSMECLVQTSAEEVVTELQPDCPDEVRKINEVGIETLRECMQTVYEDGPKRDRRLWIGDMYLESLANRYSFKNNTITKRCLYLFAALAADDGILISNCFEQPAPHAQLGSYCLTYCLLWNSTLLEYLKDTGDRQTAKDLWKVAKRQTDDAISYVDERGIFDQTRRGNYVWLFFDWRDGLDVNAPMQGAVIFALQQTYELAKLIGCEAEVAHYPALVTKMRSAARAVLYDKRRGVVLSGQEKQLSLLSQTWSVKGGILTRKEGARAIRNALASDKVLMPGTPYATHYLIEAMLACGMEEEARTYLIDYWGGMVKKGADTFWEAYDPNDDFISPYGFHPLNSACHAWSCTPVYFINKYPNVFQR